MAHAGKILGIMSYILVASAICGLLGWVAYKNPGSSQAIEQFLGSFLGDLLEGLADSDD